MSTEQTQQARMIAEAFAESIAQRFISTTEAMPKAEIPAPLKWAAAIMAAVMTAGIISLVFWIVSTLSDMQVTVARIDERQQSQGADLAGQFEGIDRRVSLLEQLHRQDSMKGKGE
jgi:hypothetical protein